MTSRKLSFPTGISLTNLPFSFVEMAYLVRLLLAIDEMATDCREF
jgi:hypothetical protein